MRRLRIDLGGGYDVVIAHGILADCGDEIRNVTMAKKLLIVSGQTVASLYADKLRAQLEACGFEVEIFAYEGGEAAKNLATLSKLLECMAGFNMCRSDCVIALGGGVTGDIAGFAASCYMRGIDLIHCPTTLLSMVDSSVGGKCAVNLSQGKNLAGAFYQPKLVLCDPDTLATLPLDIVRDGYAEIAKYAMLCKPHLIREKTLNIEEIIFESLDAKRTFIEADEFDKGKRTYLNLGHTIAHAIEKQSDYSISHGKAVAMGLAAVSRRNKAVCDYLVSHGLPLDIPFDRDALCKLMINDKKRNGDKCSVVLFRSLGSCELCEVGLSELPSVLFGE